MNDYVRTAVLLILVLLFLTAGSAGAQEVITLSGTGTGLGTMKRMIAAFEAATPGIKVRMLPSVGSTGAIKAVDKGALDIGLNGRPLKPEERALNIRVIDYARTPFVFAVNQGVGETNITPDEAVRIYRGEFTAWKSGERVRLVLRPAHEADTLIARAISPELDAAMAVALGREGMMMAATNQECHDMVAHTPGGIGLSSLTQIMTEEHRVKPLSWNGVAPTVGNLKNGTYPLVKILSLISKPDPKPPVRAFLRFIGSPLGRKILESTGNLPIPLPRL
ncbi:MAG: substrate-binding domain-containing protein [Nitrospiraceae bacterium]|nr:substrate-binding domain-containing protein [Nitrospiraceae bacterium]